MKKRKKFRSKHSRIHSESSPKLRDSSNRGVSGTFKSIGKKNHSISDIKSRLSGSRFRFLNEQLYSSKSEDSWNMFKSDPNLYKVYHEGYRNQVSQWPYNPSLNLVSWLKSNKQYKTVGDFGCGDALIARSLTDRKVYSFDLVSTNEYVTACNILKVPIPDGILDVAIFCLSLMGSDWPFFILESTRCLKIGGVLKIVEVASRLSEVGDFVKFVESYGYESREVYSKDGDFFVSFEFVLKSRKSKEPKVLMEGSKLLSPCLYKHR